jgi:endonuclease I
VKIRHFILWFGVLFTGIGYGQIPAGYYNGTEGLTGEALRSALFGIIHEHDELSFASLWTSFQSTDKKPDGKVWDMYSDIPGGNPAYTYTFVTDQCGNYAAEGDCYNREHSFPKSWFNDATPMLSDLFHVFPTDGYVNGMRSNYPYGEVGVASWTSTNGSKLGNSSFTGYSDIVFEPIDEYKGDFARTYFYMVTCYLNQVSSWSSPMLAGNNLSAWAREMLVRWSYEDPVSDKETGRNDTVYHIQANRNPYIDHPEWVGSIWGFASQVAGISHPEIMIWFSEGQIHFRQESTLAGEMIIRDIMGQQITSFHVVSQVQDFPAGLMTGIYVISFVNPDLSLNKKMMITSH